MRGRTAAPSGPRNRPEGVRIASERHGVSDCVLEACGFERADQRCGHRALAGDVEPVGRSDGFEASLEIVSVAVRDFASHRLGAFPAQGEPDRFRDGSGPLERLGLVVRDLRDRFPPRTRDSRSDVSTARCARVRDGGGIDCASFTAWLWSRDRGGRLSRGHLVPAVRWSAVRSGADSVSPARNFPGHQGGWCDAGSNQAGW